MSGTAAWHTPKVFSHFRFVILMPTGTDKDMRLVDRFVQQAIGATNGRHYAPLVNRLTKYPIPQIPIPPAANALLLDMGCNWGRWMISASQKGYVPVGIDINLEALQAATRVLRSFDIRPLLVAADLKQLPFKSNTFDVVFSYSVIQHTHRDRARKCIRETHRILLDGGYCKLQFPTRYGLANILKRLLLGDRNEDDYDSWCVRYYTIGELRRLFEDVFQDFDYEPDCYIGIGLQATDAAFIPLKYRPLIHVSEGLKFASKYIAGLASRADSIFVLAQKKPSSALPQTAPRERLLLPGDVSSNSASMPVDPFLFSLLCCPVTGAGLAVDYENRELVCTESRLAYKVIDGIPIMIPEQARQI